MFEGKMYRLQIDVENQYLTENTTVWLYLSEVREAKKKKTICEMAIEVALELFFSYSVTFFVGQWAIEMAYRERGYEAIGGEYLLMIMVFAFSFRVIRKFFEKR